nr:PAN2-PAN3 deadenylation complex catalytic subunit PAN2-like [Lepeophtheirus salmonis]
MILCIFFQISMEYMNGSNGPEGTSEDFTETEYDGDMMYIPQNEFKLVNSVVGDGTHKDREIGISTLAFDQHEELLWMGSRSGHVTSYYGTQFQKYTSFQVHPRDHIRNITTTEQSVLILTNTTLRGQHRRGVPQFNYSSKNMVDMHSLIVNNRTQRVLMGGMQESLVEYDIGSGKQVSVVNTEGSCALLREHPRFTCCGDVPCGKIQLRDPRSLALAHSLDAHTGTLSDFDVHGHHLITCGQSLRHGIEQTDRFLMVYDMRILRAISPIQSMVVPYHLRFLQSMTSQIAIMSANGQVQMADTACLATPNLSMFQVEFNLEGLNTISMDISPSNQCLAFGDTGNTIYLYSSYADPVLNPYARATEFADPVEQLPAMSIDDEFAVYSSVPRPHLPPGTNSYLSDLWPDRFCRNAFRDTPEINPEIIRSMKIIGTVGYARNVTNMKRNLVAYSNVKKHGRCDNLTPSSSSSSFNNGRDKKNHDHDTLSFSLIPKRYRKVVVKYSKLGVEDFDFDRYNRTGFCGLEATLPNAYSNSMLQILYFIENFHKMILNHVCTRETCLACELSFLFHMMNHSSGAPCQSSNFLRSLRTIPEASALGIVLSGEHGIKKCNVPRLIQSWNRFILQQTHVQCNLPPQHNNNNNSKSVDKEPSHTSSPSRSKNDSGNSPSIVSDLFGFKQDKINYCTRCKSNVASSDLLQVVNMVYPEQASPDSPVLYKFERIICSSLCPEQTTPAWCDKCRKYQPTNITRVVRSLPKILNLNAGCDNTQDINFWRTQIELTYKMHKSMFPDNEEDSQGNSNLDLTEKDAKLAPPADGIKQCRYGINCNRLPDCKFWHPEIYDDKATNADFGDRLFNENISWVPFNFTLNRHEDGTISHDVNETDSPVVESLTYDLYAVCCNIVEPSTNEHSNLVACINIGPYFHSKIASAVSQWYILNDFSISTISQQEAVWFNLSWKVPCILVFQSRSEAKKQIPYINPITTVVFNEGRSLSTRRDGQKRIAFIPLGSDEMPGPGDLTAIDAEFVTLNQEESELRSDGKVSLLKAAHVSVARITVVRGNGPLEGTPFIDDYISTQEQVVDYVTKFSGIKPGDLDANSSSKHLTTLKSTYLKLRYLVDIGVIFVGHGLKNDFRVINIVVPPEQIVDTVHLFHLPHNRMVSLKFLAWFFLKIKIQGDTHDSVEDAVTALSLYKKYLELKKDQQFITALNALYEKGKELNWKIPEDAA